MSEQVETTGRRSLLIYAWIAVPVLILAGLGVMTFFKGGTLDDPTLKKSGDPRAQDVPLIGVNHVHSHLYACRLAAAS